jgi:tetratricopeptide (TPR) repeat protein
VLYGNTLKNGYNLDDELVTISHRLTSKGIEAIPEIFSSPYYSDEMGYRYEYRPVVLATFAIEHSLFGENPQISHIINLLLYILSCLLVFKLSQMLWKNNLFFPFVVTLLFVVCPLHTEAVSSIKNRDEVISLLGGLAALYFAIRYCEKENIISLLLVPLFILIGLLSKMSVFSFVLIIPLWLIVSNFSVKKVAILSILILSAGIFVLILRDMNTHQIFIASLTLVGIYSAVLIFLRVNISQYLSRTYLTDFSFPQTLLLQYSKYDIVILMFSVFVFSYSILTENYLSLLVMFPALLLVSYRKGYYGIFDLVTTSLFVVIAGIFLPVKEMQWLYLVFFINLISHTNLSFKKQIIYTVLLLLSIGISRSVNEKNWQYIFSIIPVLYAVIQYLLNYLRVKKGQLLMIWIALSFLTFAGAFFLNGSIKTQLIIFPVIGISSVLLNPNRYKLVLITFLSLIFTLNVLKIPLPVFSLHLSNNKEISTNVVQDTIGYKKSATINPKISVVQNEDRPLDFVEFPLGFNSSISEKIATAAFVLGHYFKMMFIPYPMCFYYGYNKINVVQLSNLWAILSVVIHFIIGISALYYVNKHPIYSFGVLAYLSSIFLFSNLVSPVAGMIGDRLTYVASFGFCIAVAYALSQFYERASGQIKKIIIAGFSIVLVFYSGLTIARNAQWKDHMTLYKHDIKYLEESAQAHNLLAKRLLLESFQARSPKVQYDMRIEGIKHYEKAIAIYPDFFNPHIDLGKAYLLVDRLDDAAKMYLKATEMDTTYYDSWLQAGGIFVQLQKYPQAIACFEKVIAKDKSYLQAYMSLSEVYFRQKNYEKAIEINIKAIEVFPGIYDPVVNTGKTYFTMGDKINALIYFEKAYEINSEDRNLVLVMANLYKESGDTGKADFYFARANQIHR